LSPKSYKQSSSSSDSNSNSTTNSDSKFKSVNSFDPLQQDFHRAKSD
jgi:phospholipase C